MPTGMPPTPGYSAQRDAATVLTARAEVQPLVNAAISGLLADPLGDQDALTALAALDALLRSERMERARAARSRLAESLPSVWRGESDR